MTILSNAVAIANKVTKALNMQAKVTLKTLTTDAGKGAPVYTDKKRDAVVDKKMRQVRTSSGELAVSNASVTFLDPTVAVKEGDVIVLPDGTGNAVIATAGFVDTSGQLLTEAYL